MIGLREEKTEDLEILAAFGTGDWRKGLELLAEREKSKALKVLTKTTPDKLGEIARAQCAYLIWDEDLAGIPAQVNDFLAREAAKKQAP